ncbi:MAG: antibiotic biosynthesis monooxygenase [Chloroflexota bacterium]
MYGTIARFRVKLEVDKAEFKRRMDSFDSAKIPGWIADYIFQTDADSDVFYLVAVFKDKESYQANADDPAQHERYLVFRSFLVDDPEWNDGEIVSATGPGAS